MDTTVLDGHVIDWTTLFECHVERVHLESSSKGRGSQRSHAELVPPHSCGHEVNLRYDDDETRFFSSFGGSSWHRSDVAFIFWVLRPPTVSQTNAFVGGKALDVINLSNHYCRPLYFRSSILPLPHNILQLLPPRSRMETTPQE